MCVVEHITYVHPGGIPEPRSYRHLCSDRFDDTHCRYTTTYDNGLHYLDNSQNPMGDASEPPPAAPGNVFKPSSKPRRSYSTVERTGKPFILKRAFTSRPFRKGEDKKTQVDQPQPKAASPKPAQKRPTELRQGAPRVDVPPHGSSAKDSRGNAQDVERCSPSPPPSIVSDNMTEIRYPPKRSLTQHGQPSRRNVLHQSQAADTPPYTPHTSWGSYERTRRPYSNPGQTHQAAAGAAPQQSYYADPQYDGSTQDPELSRYQYRAQRQQETAAAHRAEQERRQAQERADADERERNDLARRLADAEARLAAMHGRWQQQRRNQEERDRIEEERDRTRRSQRHATILREEIATLRAEQHIRLDNLERRRRNDRAQRMPRLEDQHRAPRVTRHRLDGDRVSTIETRRPRPTGHYSHYVVESDTPGYRPRAWGGTASQLIRDRRRETRERLQGARLDSGDESGGEAHRQPRRHRRRHGHRRHHSDDYDDLYGYY